MNTKFVGSGEVVLIAGGGKCYTDIAARFCNSNRSLDEILASDYDAKLVKNILGSGHLAASEFDYYLFGISGYARVTEVQLVRKRIASYLISSGRDERHGNRSFDVVIPNDIVDVSSTIELDPTRLMIDNSPATELFGQNTKITYGLTTDMLLDFIESWYNSGIDIGVPEEDLRYMKPQATEFKAIVGMNAHSLLDWFMIRTCQRAQTEIRDLACKMMRLCKEASPDLFAEAGPSCVRLGYCPENGRQSQECKDAGILTKKQALKILDEYRNSVK